MYSAQRSAHGVVIVCKDTKSRSGYKIVKTGTYQECLAVKASATNSNVRGTKITYSYCRDFNNLPKKAFSANAKTGAKPSQVYTKQVDNNGNFIVCADGKARSGYKIVGGSGKYGGAVGLGGGVKKNGFFKPSGGSSSGLGGGFFKKGGGGRK